MTEEQKQKVQDVRNVARELAILPKFKEVHIIEREENLGLSNSIIVGVTEILNKYDSVIVLEDDLLTSPYFLNYMNAGLEYYQHYQSVHSIGAYNFPPEKMAIPKDYEYDTYVSLRFCSWGWAIWKDKWFQMDWSTNFYENFLKHSHQVDAFNRGGDDLSGMLLMQRAGKIDSWAIRCAYNQFANHAVTILPCISYIDNVGLDGSGTHCGKTGGDFHNDVKKAPENPKWLDVLYEDKRIVNAFYAYCNPIKLPLWKKMIRKIYRIIGAIPPASVEPKVYV